jgi:hypothetical protein
MTDPARVAAVMAAKYNGQADWQVRESLNAETVQVDGDSPILAISNGLWFMGHAKHQEDPPDGGPWGRIADDALYHADPKRRRFLQDCVYLFDAKGATTIGWGDNPGYPDAIEKALDGLITYGYFDATFKTFVMSKRFVDAPKWSPLFSDGEVGQIRKENGYYV